MTKEELFQSKSGKTFSDVKSLFVDYVVKRTTFNTRKFIVTDKDGNERYFGYKSTMGDLYNEVEKIGVEKFLDKYEITDIEPKKGTQKEKKEKKEKKETVKVKKEKKKSNAKLIEKLEEEKTDIVLKIMNFKTKRGSEEHMKLRERLHEIRDEIIQLGGENSWEEQMKKMTIDEMIKAEKEGKEKKKKAKERKTKIRKGVTK